MAEWLGNGLQNRVQQFDSAWYLKRKAPRRGFSFEVPSREAGLARFSAGTYLYLPLQTSPWGRLGRFAPKRGACCGIVQIGRVPFFCIFVSDVEVIVLLNRFWDYD